MLACSQRHDQRERQEVSAVLFFKACPRCKGDMAANRDMHGSYRECLQCGYMVDTPAEPAHNKA